MTKSVIGDIASVQTGPFGSQLHKKDYVKRGTPIVTVEHLGGRKMTRQNLPRVSDCDKSRLSKYTLQYGDLVFSRVGSVDRCSWVSEEEHGWMFSGRCLRVRPTNSSEIYHKFLYYYFCLESTKDFVRNIAVGATMPSINTKLLSEVPIVYPVIEKQRIIGDLLSVLDDKIEANAKINHHLEQMAQAVFKSWFVDFEPFADGDFIDSELGEIPAGWSVGRLSELITVKYGRDHKKLADGSIPVFGSGGVMRFADKALYNDESVLIPRKGTLNNVMYINKPFWTVDTMFYTNMNRPNIAKYVYFIVSSKDLASMNAGSAVPSMTTEILNALPVVIPSDSELARFEEITDVQFKQIQANQAESDNLAALRDTLLPRLMSGELSVADLAAK